MTEEEAINLHLYSDGSHTYTTAATFPRFITSTGHNKTQQAKGRVGQLLVLF